jgi:Holliday junction DNA helicase, RuvA subunit
MMNDESTTRLFTIQHSAFNIQHSTFTLSSESGWNNELMIAYLEGPLKSLDAEKAIVKAGGVGYLVHIPLSTYYKLEGTKDASLLIYTHVREDTIALYGFATADEKTVFEKLISISGIGPRLAQVILSGIATDELAEAIVRGDTKRLSSIPGVGKKTSERICLELRDKLILSGKEKSKTPVTRPASVADDVVSALVNLGYKAPSAEHALGFARKDLPADAEFSTLLRHALKQLTR